MTGQTAGVALTRKMHSTKQGQHFLGGRIWVLPLFFFLTACSSTPEKDLALPSPERIPQSVRDSMRQRLYPLVAGAHAAKDSIASYQWELWVEAGETLYFGLSRPTRSLYPDRREAVVGRCVSADTGFRYYEELFWTYRFPKDTLRAVVEGIFLQWRQGVPLDSFQSDFIAFPDPYSFYDIKQRSWKRLIGKDTVSSLKELMQR